MSVESRSLFDRRQAESLSHLLVIHNGFHFKNSSLRNWNILRDTRNALLGINYVLSDNKYVLLDTKHVLGDTNKMSFIRTLRNIYVLRDTKNIPQDIQKIIPRNTSNKNNDSDTDHNTGNTNKIYQEKHTMNESCCDDDAVKQIPVMNTVNCSGLRQL